MQGVQEDVLENVWNIGGDTLENAWKVEIWNGNDNQTHCAPKTNDTLESLRTKHKPLFFFKKENLGFVCKLFK